MGHAPMPTAASDAGALIAYPRSVAHPPVARPGSRILSLLGSHSAILWSGGTIRAGGCLTPAFLGLCFESRTTPHLSLTAPVSHDRFECRALPRLQCGDRR